MTLSRKRLTPELIAALAADKPTPRPQPAPPADDEYPSLDEYRYQAFQSLIVVPSWCPVNLANLAE